MTCTELHEAVLNHLAEGNAYSAAVTAHRVPDVLHVAGCAMLTAWCAVSMPAYTATIVPIGSCSL
jgi:hypothetical protein